MTDADGPQFVPGAAVTPGLARELGPPRLGQWFVDDTSAVISTSLWRRLGGGRDIIGRAITLDERQYTISGVMPPTFQLPLVTLGISGGETEVWIPLDPSPPGANRGSGTSGVYARRKPGVSMEQAQADVKRVAAIVAPKDPARYQFSHVGRGRPARGDDRVGRVPRPRPALDPARWRRAPAAHCLRQRRHTAAARSVARARETAIRVALGASRRQLALRYSAEGALVSIAGAAAGVGLSAIFIQNLLAAASAFIPRVDDITIDWTVLGFSVAVAIATGVLAAMAPLWRRRTAPNAVLSEGVRASAAAPAQRLSKAFVVAEIALAFTLLATSAILVVHMRNLERVSLGFDPDGLVAFNIALPRRAGDSQDTPPTDGVWSRRG